LYKKLEKNKNTIIIGHFLLRKLAVQENTLKGLSGEVTNSKETINYKEKETSLERIKHIVTCKIGFVPFRLKKF
jgi:hypothetical protein